MSSKNRKIPRSDWDRHKSAIVELYVIGDLTLENLAGKMKSEYGFHASISQYEAQLKAWTVRKNLKHHEWKAILDRIDDLTSRGIMSRVMISGCLVPQHRLQRARRHVQDTRHKRPRHDPDDIRALGSPMLEQVSIEIQKQDGIWSLDRSTESAKSHNPKGHPTRIDHHDSNYDDLHPLAETVLQNSLSKFTDSINRDVSLLNTDTSTTTPVSIVVESGTIWFEDLPFRRFEKDIYSKGIQLTILPVVDNAEYNAEFRFSSHIRHLVPKLPPSLFRIIADPEDGHNESPLFDEAFKTLLPAKEFSAEQSNSMKRAPQDEDFIFQFNRLLLFSIVNGFAGLGDVTFCSVVTASLIESMTAVLFQVLQASPHYVPKAFAENLFRAAIEARSEQSVRRLLASHQVGANDTTCQIEGQRYTPIERAAMLRYVGIVEVLLSAGADVNKTYQQHPGEGGALQKLIVGAPTNTVETSEWLDLVDVLLHVGAKLHASVLKNLFEYHRKISKLSYSLLFKVSTDSHSDFIENGLLQSTASELADLQATRIVLGILHACAKIHQSSCLARFSSKVNWALIVGAKRGHYDFVKHLLEYSDSLHKVLSAAIRSGHKALINLVLDSRPNINGPAHSIDNEAWDPNSWQSSETITTPLAEAIQAKNSTLIDQFEKDRVLENLNNGRCYEPAITAACKIGDLAYVKKIISLNPTPRPTDMTMALFYAIRHGHEEIVWLLLDAGADVNRSSRSLLDAAIKVQSSWIIRSILEADIGESPSNEAFDTVVAWGDRSIISNLARVFPDLVVGSKVLARTIETGDMDMFTFLVESNLATIDGLTSCLEVAIAKGDSKLLETLIKFGADPSNSSVLELAAKTGIEMLIVLLEWIKQRGSTRTKSVGAHVLVSAIMGVPIMPKAVNMILASGLFDINRLCFIGSPSSSQSPIIEVRGVHENQTNTSSINYPREHGSASGCWVTPLGIAILKYKESLGSSHSYVRKLISYGCDPNAIAYSEKTGGRIIEKTPLLLAIGSMRKDLVSLLLESGADSNRAASMTIKRTPLQQAAEAGCLEIVQLLLNAAADANARPAVRGGGTALQLAAISGNCNIVVKLLQHGVDLFLSPSKVNGRWPLEGAAEYGRLDMIGLLWKISKETPSPDEGETGFEPRTCHEAMKLAKDNGHWACADLIAELFSLPITAGSLPQLPTTSLTQVLNV
ncbi:hypothetical protein F5B20DRAFT_553273, partial [Whalleya microplaca]